MEKYCRLWDSVCEKFSILKSNRAFKIVKKFIRKSNKSYNKEVETEWWKVQLNIWPI